MTPSPRPRSITGPLIVVAIGLLFLINNIWPDVFSLSRIGDYWPFLLIAAGVIGLIEVLWHASRGVNPPPRVFYGAGIFWVLIIGLLISVAGRSHNWRFGRFDNPGVSIFGSDYEYDVNLTQSSRGVNRIVLDNLHGNLSLKGQDSGDVQITGRKTVRAYNQTDADRANQRTQVRLERQGDSLVVRTDDDTGSRLIQVSADLDISLPRGVSVESRGRNGDLTIDEIDGPFEISGGRGDVRLSHIVKDAKIDSTRGGDIHVTDSPGAVELEGRGGDIQIENIAGGVTVNGEFSGTLEFRNLAKPLRFTSQRTEFHAEAIPGSVTIDLGDINLQDVTGPVRFRTGTRDIKANDVTGGLDLMVDRGDIEITATKLPLSKIDARTHNGDVTVAVPEKAEFQIDASTSQGDGVNDFGAGIRQESNGHSATIKGGTGTGPLITIETDRGMITLKKS